MYSISSERSRTYYRTRDILHRLGMPGEVPQHQEPHNDDEIGMQKILP